jgi:hypothetical protein
MTLFCVCGIAQTPEWIWGDNKSAQAGEVRFFRKTFPVGFKAQRRIDGGGR